MIKQCKVCGKDFKTYPSKIKLGKGKYCSKECCLSVTNKVLEENGKKTRFKKGAESHNKGNKYTIPNRKTKIEKEPKERKKITRGRPHNYQGYTYTQSRKNGKRYILTHSPNHPCASKKGYVREHRLIAEQELGRLLTKEEVVHHIDGDSMNNNIGNLQVMTIWEHNSLHSSQPKKK